MSSSFLNENSQDLQKLFRQMDEFVRAFAMVFFFFINFLFLSHEFPSKYDDLEDGLPNQSFFIVFLFIFFSFVRSLSQKNFRLLILSFLFNSGNLNEQFVSSFMQIDAILYKL